MAKGRVVFEQDRSKGCGLCVSVCPKQIIALDRDFIKVKGYNPAFCTEPDECIGCGNCAIMCPDSVILTYK